LDGMKRTFLEVESEDERSRRIERLLASQVPRSTPKRSSAPVMAVNHAAPPPFRMEGPSALLARVEAFLPRMKEANEQLDASSANIEDNAVEEGEQHIEMNLGLGVFEERSYISDEDKGSSSSVGSPSSSSSSSPSSSASSVDLATFLETIVANAVSSTVNSASRPEGTSMPVIEEIEKGRRE